MSPDATAARDLVARPMAALARRLGLRDGQAYTVVSGAVVALVLAVFGLPPVIDGVDAAARPAPVPAADTAIDAGTGAPAAPSTGGAVEVATPSLGGSRAPAVTVTNGVPPTVAPGGSPPTTDGAVAPPTSVAPPPTSVPAGTAAVLAPLDQPGLDDVAVAADGTIHVVTDDGLPALRPDGSALVSLDTAGDVLDEALVAGQPAARTRGLTGVTVTPDGDVVVADASTHRLLRHTDGGFETLVTVPDLPACGLLPGAGRCQPGLVDVPPLIEDVTAARDGTLYVADRGQGIVWAVVGGDIRPFQRVADRVPGEGPVAVTELWDGAIAIAVSARLTTLPPGLPVVLRVPTRGPDAGQATVAVELGIGEVPGDIVGADSGRVYVSIPGAGVVADIGLEQGDRIDLRGQGPATLREPTGLAIRDGSLVVSEPPGLTGGAGRLLTIAIFDRPVR